MRTVTAIVILHLSVAVGQGQAATSWPLRISENSRFLVEANGAPYFPIIDTVWMLSYLGQPDVDIYLNSRRAKGFNAVLVSLIGVERLPRGLNSPNPSGHAPFAGKVGAPDTSRPNPAFFEDFRTTLRKLRQKDMAVFLIVSWASAWQEAFTSETYRRYVEFLLDTYPADAFPHIVWCLGGDKGMLMQKNLNKPMQIAAGRRLRQLMDARGDRRLISEHPGRGSSVINYTPEESSGWLDISMVQSGHRGPTQDVPDWVRQAYESRPIRPVFNGEPLYESHNPGIEHAEVRWAHWVSVFSGACAVGYGGHGFWGIGADLPLRRQRPGHGSDWWKEHLDDQPVANQVRHFSTLNKAYPFHRAAPDYAASPSLLGDRGQGANYKAALMAEDRAWALVYLPNGPRAAHAAIRMDCFRKSVRARWFDPTDGTFSAPAGPFENTGFKTLVAPGRNQAGQNDWVLVLEAEPPSGGGSPGPSQAASAPTLLAE